MDIQKIVKKYYNPGDNDELEMEGMWREISTFLENNNKYSTNNFSRGLENEMKSFNQVLEGLLSHPQWGNVLRAATESFIDSYQISTGQILKMNDKKLFTLLLTFLYILQKEKIIKFLW